MSATLRLVPEQYDLDASDAPISSSVVSSLLEQPTLKFPDPDEPDPWKRLEDINILELGHTEFANTIALTKIATQLKKNFPAWRALMELSHNLMKTQSIVPGLAYCIVLSGPDWYAFANSKETTDLENHFQCFTVGTCAVASRTLVP